MYCQMQCGSSRTNNLHHQRGDCAVLTNHRRAEQAVLDPGVMRSLSLRPMKAGERVAHLLPVTGALFRGDHNAGHPLDTACSCDTRHHHPYRVPMVCRQIPGPPPRTTTTSPYSPLAPNAFAQTTGGTRTHDGSRFTKLCFLTVEQVTDPAKVCLAGYMATSNKC